MGPEFSGFLNLQSISFSDGYMVTMYRISEDDCALLSISKVIVDGSSDIKNVKDNKGSVFTQDHSSSVHSTHYAFVKGLSEDYIFYADGKSFGIKLNNSPVAEKIILAIGAFIILGGGIYIVHHSIRSKKRTPQR